MTGQYYLRARYYNPVVGRFLQEDTYRGDGLNLYAYCANNPVMYYDPSGHEMQQDYSETQQPGGVTPGGQVSNEGGSNYEGQAYEGIRNPEEYLKDATNEFGIINQYGGISTYFKPDEGIAYWLEQIEKYALK